jgi:PBP1b-binding outer membrane lipoprotein LpoB
VLVFKKIRQIVLFVSVVMILLILASCSTKVNPAAVGSNDAKEKPIEPVTLTVLNTIFSDDNWQKIIVDPIKQKYPQITLQLANGKIEDLIASSNFPDIILAPIMNKEPLPCRYM